MPAATTYTLLIYPRIQRSQETLLTGPGCREVPNVVEHSCGGSGELRIVTDVSGQKATHYIAPREWANAEQKAT
jgi:hypothetical protein